VLVELGFIQVAQLDEHHAELAIAAELARERDVQSRARQQPRADQEHAEPVVGSDS